MIVIQSVDIKYVIKDTCYGVTDSGRVYNLLRQKELKRTVIGTTIGFCISGRFQSLKSIRKKLVKADEVKCPF